MNSVLNRVFIKDERIFIGRISSLVRKRSAVQICSLAHQQKALRKVKPFFYVLEGTYRELIYLFFKSSIFFQVSWWHNICIVYK